MGIKWAKEAVKAIKPKVVVPMHYNTFPEIKTDPILFKKMIKNLAKIYILSPGEILTIHKNNNHYNVSKNCSGR